LYKQGVFLSRKKFRNTPYIDEHGQVVVKEKKEEAMPVPNRRGQEFPSTFALEDEDAGWSDDSTGRIVVTGSTNIVLEEPPN
jgi:hypothetical protein